MLLLTDQVPGLEQVLFPTSVEHMNALPLIPAFFRKHMGGASTVLSILPGTHEETKCVLCILLGKFAWTRHHCSQHSSGKKRAKFLQSGNSLLEGAPKIPTPSLIRITHNKKMSTPLYGNIPQFILYIFIQQKTGKQLSRTYSRMQCMG